MKRKYGVDFYLETDWETGSRLPLIEFFQMSREGPKKGILLIEREE